MILIGNVTHSPSPNYCIESCLMKIFRVYTTFISCPLTDAVSGFAKGTSLESNLNF